MVSRMPSLSIGSIATREVQISNLAKLDASSLLSYHASRLPENRLLNTGRCWDNRYPKSTWTRARSKTLQMVKPQASNDARLF